MLIKIDKAGQIKIPKEYREELRIDAEVEIYRNLTEIIIKKPIHSCIFCNCAVQLVRIGNLCACRGCIERLSKAKDGDFLYQIEHK